MSAHVRTQELALHNIYTWSPNKTCLISLLRTVVSLPFLILAPCHCTCFPSLGLVENFKVWSPTYTVAFNYSRRLTAVRSASFFSENFWFRALAVDMHLPRSRREISPPLQLCLRMGSHCSSFNAFSVNTRVSIHCSLSMYLVRVPA